MQNNFLRISSSETVSGPLIHVFRIHNGLQDFFFFFFMLCFFDSDTSIHFFWDVQQACVFTYTLRYPGYTKKKKKKKKKLAKKCVWKAEYMYVTGEKMEITFFPDRGSNI